MGNLQQGNGPYHVDSPILYYMNYTRSTTIKYLWQRVDGVDQDTKTSIKTESKTFGACPQGTNP